MKKAVPKAKSKPAAKGRKVAAPAVSQRAAKQTKVAKTSEPEIVCLLSAFSRFTDHWSPKAVADLNGHQVRLVKFQGEFVWHKHDNEDELFLVHRGRFTMEFRDRKMELREGELIVVPRGVEHRPVAESEVEVVLFEPASTVNIGDSKETSRRQKVTKL